MSGKLVFIGMPAGGSLVDGAESFRRSHAGLKVRWVKPGNLHLTLVAPWECRDVGPVCRAINEAAVGLAPVEVLFDTVSFGSDPRRPRLIWATGPAPDLLKELSWLLQAVPGVQEEHRRAFLLHLTIARFNAHDLQAMASKKLCTPVEWRGTFDTICLYESFMKPGGVEYVELCRAPFTPFEK
ncbi:MAG: RNA 2',3'-cyclic phosphodiesterase [Chlorobiaceae bacterium]|nr:RNA 2',3'-cyclic phosphodiesterase [Chlorobiaceae bacterium]